MAKLGTRYHNRITLYKVSPDAFWLKVYPRGDCWEWRGAINPLGYGTFNADGSNQFAHRWAYYLCKGEIPKGLVIDHLCNHRWCVRPSHLVATSISQNAMRSPLSRPGNNARKTHCKRDHPLSGPNVRVSLINGRPARQCRTCCRLRANEKYARFKARKSKP